MRRKSCRRCSVEKDMIEFPPDKRARDGRQSSCRGCTNARNKGWMKSNYRTQNLASVTRRLQGGRDPAKPWPDRKIGYKAAHNRVAYIHGPASKYTCQCGSPAEDWAYQHNGKIEYEAEHRGSIVKYSPDPSDYAAMCRTCHRNFDLEA